MPNKVSDKEKAAVKAAVEATYPKIQDLTEEEKNKIMAELSSEGERLRTSFDMISIINVINKNTRDRSNTKQQEEDNLAPKSQITQATGISNAADSFREQIKYIDPFVECYAGDILYRAKNIQLHELLEKIKSDLIILSLAMKHASRVIDELPPNRGARYYMKHHARRAFVETYQALLGSSSPQITNTKARKLAKDLLDPFFPLDIPSNDRDLLGLIAEHKKSSGSN